VGDWHRRRDEHRLHWKLLRVEGQHVDDGDVLLRRGGAGGDADGGGGPAVAGGGPPGVDERRGEL